MVFRARDTLEIAILAKCFQRLEEFIQRFVKLLAPRRKQITGEDLIPRFQSQKALVIFLRLLRIRCNPQCVEKLRETQSSPIPNFSRSSCGRTAKELSNVLLTETWRQLQPRGLQALITMKSIATLTAFKRSVLFIAFVRKQYHLLLTTNS